MQLKKQPRNHIDKLFIKRDVTAKGTQRRPLRRACCEIEKSNGPQPEKTEGKVKGLDTPKIAFTDDAGHALRKRGGAVTLRMVKKKSCGG